MVALDVTFVGESLTVDASNSSGLVFGRGAALDIDSNPFLHRRVGRFVPSRGCWWVENLSAWTSITVNGGGSAAIVPGKGRVALVHEVSVVRFTAGSCNYEIRATLPEPPTFESVPTPEGLDDLTATYRPVDLPLTDDQRLLVVALAETRLLDPLHRHRLATNRELASRLGWSQAKFNRKLDWLCSRLDRAGVAGMRESGRRANDRRQHLVDHMIASGQITAADLALLDELHPTTSEDGHP